MSGRFDLILVNIAFFFKKIISNRVLQYVFSRYFTYLIQFVNSLLIASLLGPFYLGIWGFTNLVIQYFAQLHFGIPQTLNAISSIHAQNKRYLTYVFNTSLCLMIFVAILAMLFFVSNKVFGWHIGITYHFDDYAFIICLTVILNYFVLLFSNLFRIYNKLFEIAFSQTILPVLLTCCIIIASGKELLNWLIGATLIAYFSSVLLFVRRCPIKIRLVFSKKLMKNIATKSAFLFLYNSSFYLILITTRSFVSAFYPVKEFGYFTFAFSMANVILLLFDSFSFLILPKSINRLAKSSNEEALSLIQLLRDNYIIISHGVMHLAVLCFPVFLHFFPSYSGVETVFRAIILTVVLYTNCFGYSSLMIAKGRQKKLALLAFSSFLLNIILNFIMVTYLHVRYSEVVFATTITYFFYLLILNYNGRKILGASNDFLELLNSAFPYRLLIPYMLSMGFAFSFLQNMVFIIPFVLYLVLNYRVILNVKQVILKILQQPEVVNI